MMGPDKERYGWQHWKDSQGGKSKITAADIERAIQQTTREYAAETVEDLEQSAKELEKLVQVLGSEAEDGNQ